MAEPWTISEPVPGSRTLTDEGLCFGFVASRRRDGRNRERPLGFVDAESIAPRDLALCNLVYSDRVGEIYQGVYNADHQWHYFPAMSRDEAILIKCYDSEKDGRARFSLHSAFNDPTSPPNARQPR